MKDLIRHKLNEEIKKSDVKSEIKKYMDSSEFKSKVEKIVKDRIKNEKALEDKVVEITRNVLTQLYKQLWIKRTFWKNGLSNKSN
jgi:hypothetical protein|tara:strand:+ start:4769 stop:5023 length:255 start_codon:yes stop_codon:yes gene_type:complete